MKKTNKILKSVLAACLALSCYSAQAQDSVKVGKIITNTRMLGVGYADVLDTYITPQKYTGTDFRYISHTVRRAPGSNWSCQLVHEGQFTYTHNRANNADDMGGAYRFSYGMHRHYTFFDNSLEVKVGGEAALRAGFLYNTRGGNNPAQAQLGIDLAPSVAAAYTLYTNKGYPFTFRYEFSVPLVGVMFSPNYGQSYYEIFSEGDYDHNVVPTTIFSAPSFRHMLTLDFNLLKTTFRVGYLGDYRGAEVNDLKYHGYSSMFVIGFVKKFQITKFLNL